LKTYVRMGQGVCAGQVECGNGFKLQRERFKSDGLFKSDRHRKSDQQF